MGAYIVRRLLLVIPTLFAIMLINFAVVQVVPGGPIEQILARLEGTAVGATSRVSGSGGETAPALPTGPGGATPSRYRGAQGLDREYIAKLEKEFGFDKPPSERFLQMMRSYLLFDFGKSYFRDKSVMSLIVERMPVSISLGLWTTLLVYSISIPLGVAKAVRDGSRFDVWTSGVVIAGNAIPSFLFAIFLVVVFAGGRYLDWFPLRGLVSENWRDLSFPRLALDYLWHMVLPVAAMVIGAFASLTILTKNSFLEEIHKQYVVTARAKGLGERQVLYGHVFRNAMLIVVAGFPAALIGILFASSLLIEVIFSLEGLGLLGFEAAINRDYQVMFATLYVFTLLGLLLGLVADLTYVLVDPRIDFEGREV
jgi:microcin C transport system permease protein